MRLRAWIVRRADARRGGEMTKPCCYLVDDEELSLSTLKRLLDESQRVDIVGLSTDPGSAIADIQRLEPDALFLDIRMPEIDGFEVLAALPRQPLVVFTTAYDQHAVRAFETNAIDYLLKPLDPARLLLTLNKLENRCLDGSSRGVLSVDQLLLSVSSILKPKHWLRRVATQAKDGVSLIDVERVTYFISENRYSYACTEQGRFPVVLSLAELETRLDPEHFLRIHRSAIVNLDFVDYVSSWFAGRLYIRLRDQARSELTVGRDRVSGLRQALGMRVKAD